MSVHCVMTEKHIHVNVIYFEVCKKKAYVWRLSLFLCPSQVVCVCASARMCVYVCVITHCKEITLKK